MLPLAVRASDSTTSSSICSMRPPEQARCRNVTEVCGSACSSWIAACAVPASAERWQRSSCQVSEPNGLKFHGMSGLPSPDATESPSETISASRTTTVVSASAKLPAVSVTLSLTA